MYRLMNLCDYYELTSSIESILKVISKPFNQLKCKIRFDFDALFNKCCIDNKILFDIILTTWISKNKII